MTGETFSMPEFPNIKEHLLDAEQEVMSANAFLPGFMNSLQPADFELLDSVIALHEVSLGMWVVAEMNLRDIYEDRLNAEIADMRRQFRLMYETIVQAQASMKADFVNQLIIEDYPYDGTRPCVCYETWWDYWFSITTHECDVDCHRSSGRNCMKKLRDYSYWLEYTMD